MSARLLAGILPVALGTVFVIYASTYWIARRVLLRELAQGIHTVTLVAAAHAQAFFRQRDNDFATISQSPLFRDYYKNAEYGLDREADSYLREIERMLLDFAGRARVYPRLRYVDRAGRELCRIEAGRVARPSRGSVSLAEETLLRSLGPGRVAWVGSLRERGEPILRYAAGVFDETGRQRGALLFDCSLAPIYEVLGRLRIGRTGRSVLTRRWRGLSEHPQFTGGPVTAALPIAGTDWAVVTAVDRTQFLERLHWVTLVTLLLTLAAAVLLVAIVTTAVRALLVPIQRLAGAAQAYARGDLDLRVSAAGAAEVAVLAKAFNGMASSLQQRTADLEHRVRELTALQAMNEGVLRQLGRREIARLCLEAAVHGLGFERGVLYWVGDPEGEATGECASGLDDAAVCRRALSLSSSPELERVVRGRQAVNIGAGSASEETALMPGARSAAYCLVPILGHERVVAVVALDDRPEASPLTSQRMRSLSLFGGAVGLALENSQLFEGMVRSEARYRTAVENSPDAVIGLDQLLRVTLWNRRAEALFGYQPTEVYGRTLDFVLDRNSYAGLVRRVQTEGAIRQAEAVGRTRDGRQLELSVSWTGQNAGYGASREWFVAIQDETEKKRLQGQLLQAEKMSAVGNLVAGVAHELNNPLTGVLGYADLIKSHPVGSELAEDLRQIENSALRCRDIVQGLLFFARSATAERERVSLNAVVQATLSLCEYRLIKAEHVGLEVELDAAAPEVLAEFQKLQQVLINLLNNAADAIHGRVEPRVIRVRTCRRGPRCEMEVEDNGPGIPAAMRHCLFEAFFTTKPAGQGTGLGLSISREIVLGLSGSLRFEEPPHGGARFVMSFPPCPAQAKGSAPAGGLPPAVPGRRVLVIDDEPELVELMRRLLVEDGALCETAAGGREARRKLRKGGFDLVVADVEMGSFKGTELLDEPSFGASPPAFLFVTGDVLNLALSRELARRGATVLAKPFLRTEFLRMVRRAFHESRDRSPS